MKKLTKKNLIDFEEEIANFLIKQKLKLQFIYIMEMKIILLKLLLK